MRKITPQLGLMDFAKISNVWLLSGRHGRFLIDTGFPLERPALLYHLWRSGVRSKGDLSGVLLTHRHSDHSGNAAWLREKFDCPVICHKDDAPYLASECTVRMRDQPGDPLYVRVLCRFEEFRPARTPIDEVYGDGDWKWGFHVVPVPGHTEGSVMLYHEETRTLFSGDAILSGIPPFRLFEVARPAVKGFSQDVERCHQAVKAFLKELPRTDLLASGHGPAIREAHEKLLAMARRM